MSSISRMMMRCQAIKCRLLETNRKLWQVGSEFAIAGTEAYLHCTSAALV